MTQRADAARAWLLHRRNYRESSLLLDLFTREHGRVALVCRGAKAGRGGGSGQLQLFRPLRISWTRRGELGSLTQCESDGRALDLPGERLWCGFYLNELLLRLLAREDPHPEMFDVYDRSVRVLASRAHAGSALRRFEWKLLEHLGYGFDPTRTALGGAVDPARHYRWRSGLGVEEVAASESAAVPGPALLALAQTQDGPALNQSRRLLGDALAEHIPGGPLKSALILRSLRRYHEAQTDKSQG